MMKWIKKVRVDKVKQKAIEMMQGYLQDAGFDYNNKMTCFGKNMFDILLQFFYFSFSVLLILCEEGALISLGLNAICFASNWLKHSIAASKLDEKLKEYGYITDNIKGVTHYSDWSKCEIIIVAIFVVVTCFAIFENPGGISMELGIIKFFSSLLLFICFIGNIENNVVDIFSAEIKVQKYLNMKSE